MIAHEHPVQPHPADFHRLSSTILPWIGPVWRATTGGSRYPQKDDDPMALSRPLKIGGFVVSVFALSIAFAQAEDGASGSPPESSSGGIVEQVQEDAGQVVDKTVEIGKSVGDTAEQTADTVTGKAETAFDWAKKKSEQAYRYSKRKLEELFH